MANELEAYRDRYILAIRKLMAEREIETYQEIAEELGISNLTLSSIVKKRQMPTVQHAIDLCNIFDISPSWLLLGKGERTLKQQATLNRILNAIQKISV